MKKKSEKLALRLQVLEDAMLRLRDPRLATCSLGLCEVCDVARLVLEMVDEPTTHRVSLDKSTLKSAANTKKKKKGKNQS